jgi:hypothetical protein
MGIKSFTATMRSAQNKMISPSGNLAFDKSNGWIMWKSYADLQERRSRLCWLPAELRGEQFASHEGMFVIASGSTNQLIIIDFTPMLKSLYDQGFIFSYHVQ